MLKHIIFTLINLAILNACFAQVHTLTKGDGYNALPTDVPYRSNHTIIVKGYNPFATKLNGKGIDIDLSYSTPAIFNNITAGNLNADETIESVEKEQQNILKAGVPKKKLNEKKQELEAAKSCLQTFVDNYNEFINHLQHIYALYRLEDHIKQIIDDPEISKQAAEENIDALINSLSPDANPRMAIQSCLTSVKRYHSEMKACYDKLSNTLDPETFNLSGELNDSKKSVTLVIKDGSTVIERKKYFKEEMAYATEKVAQLMTDTIWTAIVYKVAKGMDLKNRVFSTEWQHSYVVGQVTEDIKEIELTVTDQKGNNIQEYGKFQFHSYGQLKVDVSAGYLIAFGGDDNYGKVPDANGKIVGIKKQKRDFAIHSVGALVHVYKKSKSGASLGGSAGFSLPVDGRFNFYLGGSALFSGKSRLVITGGIGFARIQVLNDSNIEQVGTDKGRYSFINPEDTDIRYDNVHRLRPFLGITYNFAELKKD